MTDTFLVSFLSCLQPSLCDSEQVLFEFTKRLEEKKYTKGENPTSHFGAFLVPYDPQTNRVFITDHKKSGLWLFPGGHVDLHETIFEAAIRETQEELGVVLTTIASPFFFSHTIPRQPYPCKEHFDSWFLFTVAESSVVPDMREFHQTKWVSINQAKTYLTDGDSVIALRHLQKELDER